MAEMIGHFPPNGKEQIVDTLFSIARSNLQKSRYERAAETTGKIVDADVAMTRGDVLDVYVEGAYLTGAPTEQDGIVFTVLNGIRGVVNGDEGIDKEIRSSLYVGGTPETSRLVRTMVGAGEPKVIDNPSLPSQPDLVVRDTVTESKTNLGFTLFERKTIYQGGLARGGIRKTTLEAVVPARVENQPQPNS